ncbi:hypothetical protein L7F22_054937 [Adiantum nelumboides]|nr:hypothetical protein [Adiantum nelumboides]
MPEAQKRRHSKSSAPSGPADSDESPKAAKRDGKPATERQIPAPHDPEASIDPTDNSRGRKRRLQDPLPLEETPRRGDVRASFQRQQPPHQPSVLASENDAAIPTVHVNPMYVPRSGYYFQHDDRTGPPSGRSNKRRDFERDGRAEPRSKGRYDDRPRDDYRGRRNDRHFESSQASFRSKAADDAWSHDKFLESQAEDLERKRQPTVPPERTRQSGKREFRETPPLKAEIVDEAKSTEADRRPEKRLSDNNDKGTERGFSDANLVQRDRNRNHERAPELERGRWMDSESSRGRFNPRRSFNRYNGDGDRGGGQCDNGRRNSGGHGTATDRWHHDMFEELSRTPTLKKEEDSVAQIEALLAT